MPGFHPSARMEGTQPSNLPLIMPRSLFIVVLLLITPSIVCGQQVDFNRDVRPILAAKCFACHGPDDETREADLRLDQRDEAVESGALLPGMPDESELVRRIDSTDLDERMPPPDSNSTLTVKQREILKQWVAAGAKYDRHWAFVPPKKSDPPPVDSKWVRNEIDHFILSTIREASMAPSPEASKMTLVRRLYLDLVGMPPTPAEADAFVQSDDPKAYEKLVDELLKSPRYGERWARPWLDLARYSDTNGYEKDRNRSIWPYRDWVIRALNDDMPFDQFTIEQLAGDMLPDATSAQRTATGFHRNTMLNEEGGIDPLEYRFYAMVDRVATTGTVWLGMTVGCAQCHSHKYDPITHTDYYRMMALLNNAEEPDWTIRDANRLAKEAKVREQMDELRRGFAARFPPVAGDGTVEERRAANLKQKLAAWIDEQRALASPWEIIRPHAMETNLPHLEVLDDGSIFSRGDITKRDVFTLRFNDLPTSPITAIRLEALPDERLPAGGPGRTFYEGRKGDFFLSELSARAGDQPLPFASGSTSYGKISIGSGNAKAENVFDHEGSTGWSTSGNEGKSARLVLNFEKPAVVDGELVIEMLFERHFATSLGRFRIAVSTAQQAAQALPWSAETEAILAADPSAWTAEQEQHLQQVFLDQTPELKGAHQELEKLRKQLPTFPTTMVMQERHADNARPTHRHHRGEFLSPKESVVPGIPAIFQPLTKHQPTNRLEFAQWLASAENPLVARVVVNRAWRALLGVGIMRTSGDFGTQSDPPTHPELLDWLAVDFMENGWSMKRLHKQIVMSATYRQDSKLTSEGRERDPDNRLYARGPRYRVDAETVRDTMLKASGVLSSKMYGPSVYPPQPSVVTALAYGGTPWKPSTGEDRYRRSLYTFNKRTAPFAAYTVFDGPTGENCIARRNRSNTPLQALTLLNDEMFMELARAAAGRLAEESTPDERATTIFRNFLTRQPTDDEVQLIVAFQQKQLKRIKEGKLDATKIAKRQGADELASWVLVARAIMNLDETITRQ